MSATDRAYRFTKQRILDGRFDGGDLISEGDVAVKIGLSRTPVREAFLRLEGEGLLRLYPKRGALVVPVSVTEIESVMETRLLVERHAIEKVIRMGAPVADALHRSLEQQTALIAEGRALEFVEADREFHRLFVAAAGNAILLGLHDSLRDRQSRMNLAAIGRDEGRVEQIRVEHESLASAVIAGELERALALVQTHLDGTLALLHPGFHAV
ncbi:MAG: GntR family transcriptional regulator [Solirubrobacteraceae bacterium]